MSASKKIFIKARAIALSDLRANYGNLGIYAGPNRHKEYWARDSFITSLGVCSMGDFEQVKTNLDLFSQYQRSDGHIPARVEERFHSLRAIGLNIKHKNPIALHRQSQPWATDVVDSNSWYIISATNYLAVSRNKSWLNRHKNNLTKAADWLLGRIGANGLVYEGCTANWSDCNLRSGYIIYNNVLAWKALNDLGKVLLHEGKGYVSVAEKLKKNIVNNFWDETLGYFIDRIDKNGKKYKYFYSDGNLLAIWFDLMDKKKGNRIFHFIDKHNLNLMPVPSGYPALDRWNALINQVVFPMYQTRNIFTWWGCVSALARMKLNDQKGAMGDLRKVAEKIEEYGVCHEVLTPQGKPVNLWFYNSEKQIAWTAGMYLYAFNELNSHFN